MHYHIPVTRILGSKFLECVHPFEQCGLEYPPPRNKIWSGLGTWIWSWSGVPPTPPPENENLVRTWHFAFELVWSTTTPQPRTYVGAGVWRLIAVFPKDTVSFSQCHLEMLQKFWPSIHILFNFGRHFKGYG